MRRFGAMDEGSTSQDTPAGWEALLSGEWRQATAAFEAALADGDTSGQVRDGLGRARWWLSDIPGAIASWEDAYTTYRRSRADEAAAHVALLLSREHAHA